MKLLRLLMLTILFFCNDLIGQTGPGGVGDNSNNIVWLDANRELLTNGLFVSTLQDFSGNGNDFTQNLSGSKPTFGTNLINGLPAIQFDGTNDWLDSDAIPDLETTSLTYVVVFKRSLLQSQTLLSSKHSSLPSSVPKWATYSNAGSNALITAHYSPTIKHTNYIDPGVNSFVTVRIFPTYFEIFQDGQLKATKVANYTVTGVHEFLRLGGKTNSVTGNFLDGYISEAFIYNTALNDLELNIVHNYVGAKYNITPFQDRYAYEATHNLGVIGIGKNATNTHSVSKGSSILTLSKIGSTNFDMHDYIFTGHNGIALSSLDSTDMPLIYPTYARWSRTWRFDESGTDMGTINLTFDLSAGINNFADPTTYVLLQDANADGDGLFSTGTVTGITGTYDAVNKTMSFSLNPVDGVYFTLAGKAQILNIYSVASGDWSDANTWSCSCIPSVSDSVHIQNADSVVLDIDAAVYDLSLESAAKLAVLTNVNLDIHGNFDIQGKLYANDGQFSFVGNTTQMINANTDTISLNDIYIQTYSSGTVTFTNGVFELNSTLFPVFGDMIVDSTVATKFIVNSTSANTSGRIDEVISGFNLHGDVIVRRFIPSGVAGNRNLASPVLGATLAEWDNDLFISGSGFPDGCAYGDTTASGCYNSVKRYYDNHYIDVTDINYSLGNGLGYEVFCGDDLTVFSGTTLEVEGQINHTDVTIQTNSGWKIVGNPYASPVLFSQASFTNSLGKYFYVVDAQSGTYQYYDKVSNTASIPTLSNGLIAIGQGMWVNGFGFLTFPQSSKSSSSATFIRNSEVENALTLTMKQENSTFFHNMTVSFLPEANDGFDEFYDILHLSTGKEKASSIFMLDEDKAIRKNYTNFDGNDKIIDVKLNCLTNTNYTIESSNVNDLTDYENVYLFDKYLNKMIDLRAEETYTFYSEVGAFDRFKIIFSNNVLSTNDFISAVNTTSEISITQLGNAIEVSALNGEINNTVYVTNTLGQEIISGREVDLSNGPKLLNLPADLNGLMIVVVKNKNGITTKKIIL